MESKKKQSEMNGPLKALVTGGHSCEFIQVQLPVNKIQLYSTAPGKPTDKRTSILFIFSIGIGQWGLQLDSYSYGVHGTIGQLSTHQFIQVAMRSNVQDKAKEAMSRAQEAMSNVQDAFEGESTSKKLKGQARDAWKDTKVALGVDHPRWTTRHPYLLNIFITLFSLLLVVGAGYAVAKFARNRQVQKRVRCRSNLK